MSNYRETFLTSSPSIQVRSLSILSGANTDASFSYSWERLCSNGRNRNHYYEKVIGSESDPAHGSPSSLGPATNCDRYDRAGGKALGTPREVGYVVFPFFFGPCFDGLVLVGTFRREGKNRRDSSTVSTRVLSSVAAIAPKGVEVTAFHGFEAPASEFWATKSNL